MPTEAVRAVPTIVPPSKPNFMVVDGKTFIVEKIEQSPEDMLKHVEQYYETNLQEARDALQHHISTESQHDLDLQVKRIERHLSQGIVAIPDHLRQSGTVLMLNNNKVYETRILMFKPSRISCTMQRINDYVFWIEREVGSREKERFSKFMDWAKPMAEHFRSINQDMSGIKIDVLVDQNFITIPMVASFCPEESLIHVRPKSLHPHVYDDGHLCTGQARAQVFWEDPRFSENFNSLNPHSFANSSTDAAHQHRNMLKNASFLEARIRTQEVSAWRV